ncbi:MAG: anaerobic ribonucleoside-triphosphate reductase activating protein [Candidatus Diapherotrites archaeon]
MIFRGIQKTTLIDYPHHIATTLFVDKCNFRCGFCQNPLLVLEKEKREISEKEALEFLKNRKKYIEGVCITGGEPTVHGGLKFFATQVKELGLKVKIDTNGTNPALLRELISEKKVDYIAMDIKAPLEKYDSVANVHVDIEAVKESIAILKEGKVDYEFRTTVVPPIICLEDIEKIGIMVQGAKFFALQQFVNDVPLLDEKFQEIKPYPVEVLKGMAKMLEKYVKRTEVRE